MQRHLLPLLLLLFAIGLHAQSPFLPWKAGTLVSSAQVASYGENRCFLSEPISDDVFARINGNSFRENPDIRRSDLRYLRLLHTDADGHILLGEMICNKAIAQDLLDIFHELYRQHYPIQRMTLIDDYGSDDERSMRDNNTSCFCYRAVSGTKTLSKHARGLAVDVNPFYNPYVKVRADGTTMVQPQTAKAYADRSKAHPYVLRKGDLCYRLFIRHGFRWGGAWRSCKDYQHFEK